MTQKIPKARFRFGIASLVALLGFYVLVTSKGMSRMASTCGNCCPSLRRDYHHHDQISHTNHSFSVVIMLSARVGRKPHQFDSIRVRTHDLQQKKPDTALTGSATSSGIYQARIRFAQLWAHAQLYYLDLFVTHTVC